MYEGRGLDIDARSVKSSDNNNKASKSSGSKLTRQNSALDQRQKLTRWKQRVRDKIQIRMSLLKEAFEGLEKELIELRNRRLGGEDFSESDNRERSIQNEYDEFSKRSITEEEKRALILTENQRLMEKVITTGDLLDQYCQMQEFQLHVLPLKDNTAAARKERLWLAT